MVGHGSRILAQAIYFVIVARALGVEGFGAFAAVVAFIAILAPFSNVGSGHLLIKNVARDTSTFPAYWGNALMLTVVSGGILLGIAIISGSLLLFSEGIGGELIVLVGLADLIFARLIEVSAQVFQAFQLLRGAALIQVLLSSARLGAAIVLSSFFDAPEAVDWATLYLSSSAITAVIGMWWVVKRFGLPEWPHFTSMSELRESFLFSVSQAAQSAYNEMDKTILARISTLEAVGTYASAYRIINVAFTPIMSLLWAAYARFFQHGADGIGGSLRFARRLLPHAAAYAVAIGTVLYLTAPLVTWVLGADYRATATAIRMLAVLPLLKGFQYFLADTLTGAGHQGYRSLVQVGSVAVNVLLSVWLISLYSWRGAALAAIISNTLLGGALLLVVTSLRRRERTVPVHPIASSG